MKTLRSKYSTVEQKCNVINEFTSWFDFDNDQSGMPTIVRSVVSMISSLSSKRDPDLMSSITISTNLAEKNEETKSAAREEADELQLVAQNCLITVLKSVMNASATAHIITATDANNSYSGNLLKNHLLSLFFSSLKYKYYKYDQ